MSRICKTCSQIGASSIINSIMVIILITIIMIMNMIMIMIMIMIMTMGSYHQHEAHGAVRGSVGGCPMDMWCPYGIGREFWDRVIVSWSRPHPLEGGASPSRGKGFESTNLSTSLSQNSRPMA